MEPSGSPSTAPEKVLDCNLVALWNNILDDLTELSRRDPMRARADIHNLLNARHAAPAPYYNARLHGLLCCVNFELKEYNLAAFQCDIAGHILESCDMRDVQEENVHAWDDVVEFILDCEAMVGRHFMHVRSMTDNAPSGSDRRDSGVSIEREPIERSRPRMPVYEDAPEDRDPFAEADWVRVSETSSIWLAPNGDIIDLGVYHRDDDATIQEGQEGMQGSD